MNDAYRKLMERQSLSGQADADFYEKLEGTESQRKKKLPLKLAVIAACVCLLLPAAAFAAGSLFGFSLVDFAQGELMPGIPGEGYDVDFTNVYGRSIMEFSPELQSLDEHRRESYASWEDAEAALGIDLITNTVLSDEKTAPEKTYDLQIDPDDTPRRRLYHCMADYEGKAGQFYLANVYASYKRDGMLIDVCATVTAEHPAVSQKETEELHRKRVTYADVVQMTDEQYTAENGLTAAVVTVDRAGAKSTCYEANFVANGVSYRICVDGYDSKRDAEAKQLLLDILEGFSFTVA